MKDEFLTGTVLAHCTPWFSILDPLKNWSVFLHFILNFKMEFSVFRKENKILEVCKYVPRGAIILYISFIGEDCVTS